MKKLNLPRVSALISDLGVKASHFEPDEIHIEDKFLGGTWIISDNNGTLEAKLCILENKSARVVPLGQTNRCNEDSELFFASLILSNLAIPAEKK